MFAITRIAAACTAIALIATAGIASAEPFESNGRTTEVRYHDLDLSIAADQKALRSRIRHAALKVCSAGDMSVQRECMKQAIAHVEAPIGAAIARARTGERYADARAAAGN